MTSGDSVGYVVHGPCGSVEFSYEEWRTLYTLVAMNAGHSIMKLPSPLSTKYQALFNKMGEAG